MMCNDEFILSTNNITWSIFRSEKNSRKSDVLIVRRGALHSMVAVVDDDSYIGISYVINVYVSFQAA